MKIAEFQKESYKDYPGKISSVVFTSGCNYNCGYCHNPEFKKFDGGEVSEENIFRYIDSRRDWIEAIVLCGGEPTVQLDLLDFIVKAKDRGLAVKLDTNGSNPNVLKELLEQNTVDYVAMDIKGPIGLYPSIIGKDFIDVRDYLVKSLGIVSQFPNYEFRTTIIPVIKDGKMRWMSPEEVGNTAKWIYDQTGINEHKYFLQPFKAIEKEEGNKDYMKKNLTKEMRETPRNILEESKEQAKLWLPKTEIRN